MLRNQDKIIAGIENLFPNQVKVYSLDTLSYTSAADSHDLLHRTFNKPPVKEKLDKLLAEITCFLKNQAHTTAYSFYYRLPKNNLGDTDWVFCSAKLNRCHAGLPKEVVIFSYELKHMDGIKKRLYRVLENEEFFKENFNKVCLLTKRENDIIRLLAAGLDSMEIAAAANISVHTVYTHRKSINNKLSIKNFATLLKFADVFDMAAGKTIV